jgi:hypothetical protein
MTNAAAKIRRIKELSGRLKEAVDTHRDGARGEFLGRRAKSDRAIHRTRQNTLSPMPKRTLPRLTAYLWDLRAQCETQIRALTDAQRQIDTLRDSSDYHVRTRAFSALNTDLAQVRRVHGEILASVNSVIEQVARLALLTTSTNKYA